MGVPASAIDLNCDLPVDLDAGPGELEALLDLVTSANVSCGFGLGAPSSLRRLCALAADRRVAIGAHVSYPTVVGSGHVGVDVGPAELRDAVLYQLGALDGFAQVAGAGVAYVKPQGALYRACSTNRAHAEAVVEAAREYDWSLAVLGAPGSILLRYADDRGLDAFGEGFVDRPYDSSGEPIDHDHPSASLEDTPLGNTALGDTRAIDTMGIAAQAVALALDRMVLSNDGTPITVHADSLYVPFDSPDSVKIASAMRDHLEAAGVSIASFK